MSVLIWGVYLLGAWIAFDLGGLPAFLGYAIAVSIVIRVFKRQFVIGLTHLASKLGVVQKRVQEMPLEIHLVPSTASEAAQAARHALLGCGFVDAGTFSIAEMPKIGVALLVHPAESMLAVVESASSFGAQVNLHTLYEDTRIFTLTNSELPGPKADPPGVTRRQLPKCAPAVLFSRAKRERPQAAFRKIGVDDAARTYGELYTMWTTFQKANAA